MVNDDFFKRIDVSQLHPSFVLLLDEMITNTTARGISYYATCGMRSFDEQAKLYAYGRTDPSRGIVTKAQPGYSAHQYGFAVDFTADGDPGKAGLQPSWDIKNYRILAEEAQKLGLEAAYYWQNFKEGPHIQLPLKSKGIGWDKLIATHKTDGLKGCWDIIDTFEW